MALTDSLISYWKLDEASGNALDTHGSNELTETDGTIAATTGKINGCRDFENDDTEGFVIADNTDLSTGDIDFTIACWVNPETVSGNDRIVSKWRADTGQREYSLLLISGVPNFQVSSNGTSYSLVASSGGALSTSTWYYLVAWHDASANTINIQVNNGTPSSSSYSSGVFDGPTNFVIGFAYASGGAIAEPFDGLIDEVGFWKRTLTSDERTSLYNSGSGLAYGSFDGVSGSPHNYYAQCV